MNDIILLVSLLLVIIGGWYYYKRSLSSSELYKLEGLYEKLSPVFRESNPGRQLKAFIDTVKMNSDIPDKDLKRVIIYVHEDSLISRITDYTESDKPVLADILRILTGEIGNRRNSKISESGFGKIKRKNHNKRRSKTKFGRKSRQKSKHRRRGSRR